MVDSAGVALTCRAAMTAGVATPMYAAPEVSFAHLESDCVAGASQDIWSFGAVAFELRVGEPLFFGRSEGAQWRTAVCRLGPPPEDCDLGPRRTSLWHRLKVCAEDLSGFETKFPPLAEVSGLEGFVELVRVTCAWRPEERPTAAELTREALFLGVPPAGAQATSGGEGPVPHRQAASEQATPSLRSTLATPAPQGAPMMFRLFPDLPPLPTEASAEGCQCKGHCYQPGHRYRGGCSAQQVVVGTDRCGACACSVRSCTRPRNSSPFCLAHKKVFAGLPLPLKCLWASRRALARLVPSDIEAFAKAWPRVRHNPVVALTACWIKEPEAIRQWCSSEFLDPCRTAGPEVAAEAMRESLWGVLAFMSGCPHPAETQQMSQQGGARNLGPARVAVALGLIQASPSGEHGEFRLGRTGRAYHKLSGDTCLESLLAAASRTSEAWQVARTAETPGEVVRGILEVFAALTASGLRGLRVTGDDSYMRLFFVRMVLLARMAEGSAMIENLTQASAWKREKQLPRDPCRTAGPEVCLSGKFVMVLERNKSFPKQSRKPFQNIHVDTLGVVGSSRCLAWGSPSCGRRLVAGLDHCDCAATPGHGA